MQYEYLAIGKLRRMYQSHQGAVNTMTTPHVWLSYVADVDGDDVYTKALRRQNTNYPLDASAVAQFYYNTDSSVDGRLHRPRYQKLFNAALTSGEATLYYEYNGTGRVARTYAHSDGTVDIERTMATAAGVYGAWDRFGRTRVQKWFRGTTTHDQIDHHALTDFAGNHLIRDIPSSLYAGDDLDQGYEYDGLQRLANYKQGTIASGIIINENFEQDWTLDQLGNWPNFKQDNNGNGTWDLDQSRSHNAVNELEEFTTTSWADPAYDAAGNMTTMPQIGDPATARNATYDAWNRLVEYDVASGLPKYEYDGLNHLIVRSVLLVSNHFYYNDQWQVIVEERSTLGSSVEAIYAWHPYYIDALAVRFRANDRHYFLHDDNFNVTAAYDVNPSSGTYRQVVERYTYTPYGEVTFLNPDFTTKGGSSIDNRYLYTGRERDSVTKLQLNRNRYYHAGLGRWLTQDPIGYEGKSTNLYGYVAGMPTRFVDPTGTYAWWPPTQWWPWGPPAPGPAPGPGPAPAPNPVQPIKPPDGGNYRIPQPPPGGYNVGNIRTCYDQCDDCNKGRNRDPQNCCAHCWREHYFRVCLGVAPRLGPPTKPELAKAGACGIQADLLLKKCKAENARGL